MSFNSRVQQISYPFKLNELPFNKDALSEYVSRETLEYHHGKHHQGYVNKLNDLLKDSSLKNDTLEDVIVKSYKQGLDNIFNNSAQIWNHDFYWHSLKLNCKPDANNQLIKEILQTFGSMEKFKENFLLKSTHFGSAWIWLILDKNRSLKITSTSNAELPITAGEIPIITCDIWEHAYYIDYRNRRADYVEVFLNHLINWEFAEKNFLEGLNFYK